MVRVYISLIIVAAACNSLGQIPENVFVVEHDRTTGRSFRHDNLDFDGEITSKFRAGSRGLEFQLFAESLHPWDPEAEHYLGRIGVGVYLPQGTITVQTKDRTNPSRRRTRVDHAYDVTVGVAGMIGTMGANHQRLDLRLYEQLKKAGVNEYGAENGGSSAYELPNGTYYFTEDSRRSQNGADYPPISPTVDKGYGVEIFRLLTFETWSAEREIVAEGKAYVLPMASMDFSGITNNQTVTDPETIVTVTGKDLYPYSKTWLQIYPGAPRNGVVGTILGYVEFTDANGTFTKQKVWQFRVGDVTTQDGRYTVEMVTDVGAAFAGTNPEVTGRFQFVVENGMNINTEVNTGN